MKTYKHKKLEWEAKEIEYDRYRIIYDVNELQHSVVLPKELIESSSEWVLRKEELTYEMICEELKEKGMYVLERTIPFISDTNTNVYHKLNSQVKLINCALYFNGDEKIEKIHYYYLILGNNITISTCNSDNHVGEIRFNTKESAEETLRILGSDTIKQALNLIN